MGDKLSAKIGIRRCIFILRLCSLLFLAQKYGFFFEDPK